MNTRRGTCWIGGGLAALLVAAAGGCAPRAPTAPRVALVPKGTTHEFWKSIHAGGRRAARDLGVELIWKGPLREDDRNAQIEVVETLLDLGVDALVLAPLDNTSLCAPVAAAAARGRPVVILDSGLDGTQHVSFVATDNRLAGRRGGEHLAALLNGTGRVAMLRYQEGSQSTMERERGFLDAMAANPGIAVVSANQYGGATTETAYKAGENLLAPLRRGGGLALDGLFCPNESTTFGMLRALQDAGLAGRVRLVGFDSSPKLAAALRAGELDGLVLQDPVTMGYRGVETAVQALRGESVPPRIDTGSRVVTRAAMDDPAARALLEPDLSDLPR